MPASLRWRALVVVGVVAGAAALVAFRPVRLGLDLRGGTQIVLETRDTEQQKVDRDTVSRTLEVLRRRVDALGVAEPALQRSGDRRIIVEPPGVTDPDEAVAVIGRTAQLAFRPVLAVEPAPADSGDTTDATDATDRSGPPAGGVPGPPPLDQEVVLPDEGGSGVRLGPSALTGAAVGRASAEFQSGSGWLVSIGFRGDGGRQWAELTGEAACHPDGDAKRRVAIVLDREVISSPRWPPTSAAEWGSAGVTRSSPAGSARGRRRIWRC